MVCRTSKEYLILKSSFPDKVYFQKATKYMNWSSLHCAQFQRSFKRRLGVVENSTELAVNITLCRRNVYLSPSPDDTPQGDIPNSPQLLRCEPKMPAVFVAADISRLPASAMCTYVRRSYSLTVGDGDQKNVEGKKCMRKSKCHFVQLKKYFLLLFLEKTRVCT